MKSIALAVMLLAGAAAAGAAEIAPGASLHGFTVKSVSDLPEVSGRLVRMTYEKNGADLAWLDRADDNKTFAIIFRTIPGDDTGVAHIIEHSVLCGSEKYPVKDPFVELCKSSFATFINAMTGPDHTTYPICSRNDVDFQNLMDVYLDAVFHPLSVKSPLPFRQEGWHYEFSKDGELALNGVVFSEMKGNSCSPATIARRKIKKMLFPDNCYGLVSGGDPESIPDLTFEKHREFYLKHYHPSNARIFLDGRVDLPATLKRLDVFLSAYDRREIDTAVPLQAPVASERTEPYALAVGESAADKTVLMDGWVFGTWRDREECIAFDVLTDVLADSNEAPLKKALIGNGLCGDVIFTCSGSEQMSVYLLVKNVRDGKADEVRRTVRTTLEDLARNGLDHRRINAIIDRCEFQNREKDTGGYPRGLVFMMNASDTWLYGGDPADAFRDGELYSAIRKKAAQGWFEDLLRRALLDNPHHAKLTLTPSPTLDEERRKAEKAALAATKAKWTPEELARAKADAAELEAYQKRADSPDDLAKLPLLSLKDIPEKGPAPEWTQADVDGTRVFWVKTSANGIVYVDLFFELGCRSREELFEAAILAKALGNLPTSSRSLQELNSELDANLGRFSVSVRKFARPGDRKNAKAYIAVRASALESKIGEIARLVPEVLKETSFNERLTGDLVRQRRRSMESATAGRGGSHYARTRAAASQSAGGAIDECLGGIEHLRRLQALDDSFEKNGAEFCRRLTALALRLFSRRALTAFVSDNAETGWLEGLLAKFPQGEELPRGAIEPFPAIREGFRTTGNVGAAAKASFPGEYTGTGRVAAGMLSRDYLWHELRVLGGAYGGGFSYLPAGSAVFSSHDDPNPARSLGVYDGAGDALRRLVAKSQSVDKYIIGAVARTEPYLTPSVEMSSAAELALSGRAPDDLQRLRGEMLRTEKNGLLRFADTLDSLTNSTSICVVGGAAQIDGCTNLLDKVESVAR